MDEPTEGSAAGSGRQRRALETRQRILDAALEPFARKGHDGVNLRRDILEPAGVSVGSFYHQFTDKTDLLVSLLREGSDRRRRQIFGEQLIPGPESGDAVRRGLEAFFAGLDRNEAVWRIQIRERAHPDPRIRRVIAENQADIRAAISGNLRGRVGASGPRLDRAVQFAYAFTSGLAPSYLEVPLAERPAMRAGLLDDAAAFLTAGLAAILLDQ